MTTDKTIITLETGEQKTLTFYKSITDFPIKRYQLLQKYSLIDAGIGSTYEDVIRHLSRMDEFIKVGDMESISIERENMLMNFNFMLNESYIKTYSFVCLIKTIDGVALDITDDNIDELVNMLECSDLSVSVLDNIVDLQKKTLITP